MRFIKILKNITEKTLSKQKSSIENYKNLRIGVTGAGNQGTLLTESVEEAGAKCVLPAI